MKCGRKHNNAICVYQNKRGESEEKLKNKNGGEVQTPQLNISTKNAILLQTARAKVSSENSSQIAEN